MTTTTFILLLNAFAQLLAAIAQLLAVLWRRQRRGRNPELIEMSV